MCGLGGSRGLYVATRASLVPSDGGSVCVGRILGVHLVDRWRYLNMIVWLKFILILVLFLGGMKGRFL